MNKKSKKHEKFHNFQKIGKFSKKFFDQLIHKLDMIFFLILAESSKKLYLIFIINGSKIGVPIKVARYQYTFYKSPKYSKFFRL